MKMKPTVLLLAVLGSVAASPNGYYHQEYNYKTSASSYKNNELQHQTDDQGYYRKDGDLEGKVRPRVDANSEHSEYVNPNLRNSDYNARLHGSASGDLSSLGHMRANVGSVGGYGLSSDGLAHSDHIVGTKSGAYSGSGSYGTNSYGSRSYATSSNLRSVTSHIQQELERDLQRAIQENRAYSQGISLADLERELRHNLTSRLNTELANRYGQQSVRGGLSYTISGGRLHSTANYDNQELQDLRAQLENNLLNQLRTQSYQSSSRYETHQTSQNSQNNYGYSTTVRPVYYQQYPAPYRPTSYVPDNQIRYTPIPNPESITTIASRVQNQLDTRLNAILDEVKSRYFSSSSSYSVSNADLILENLRNELRNNITFLLNEDVKSNYGNQIPRDGHMYSVGPSGQTSSEYNYSIKDLENLRSQVERNLIEKLNRDFETYKTRWYQQSLHSQSSHGSSNIHYGGYSTPRYNTYNAHNSDVEQFTTRPLSSHITPLITSGDASSSNNRYNIIAGSRQSGYEVSGGSGSSSIAQLQRQLQQDLSRQLQAAISRGHYGTYSTSNSYNPQSYQSSLQELSNELNRNLTRQLQEYSASGYYSSYGNFDQAQLANLRNQLQADLQRQLQQGLQQSFQSSSSYSASSSSSSSNSGNYRPVRGFDNYHSGQYRSGGNVLTMNGEDCAGDDPNAYNNHRMKRSYQPYRSRPLGVGYGIGGSYRPNYDFNGGYNQQQQAREQLGQQVDESDLTQQSEDASFEKLQQDPLLQQQINQQQQVSLGQQVDDSDLKQQVEVENFGKLQLGSQNQEQVSLGQQVDDSDLTQQVEDQNFGQLQLGSHSQQQVSLGQDNDSDLTQQVEDQKFGQLQLGSHSQQQVSPGQGDDSDLTQQVEGVNFGQLQLGSQSQQQVSLGQQVDDSDLTQQVEDQKFGQLQLGSQNQQQVNVGRYTDDSDLTQQTEVENLGKVQLGSQNQQVSLGQHVDDPDLTQQVEDEKFGQFQLGSQNQHQVSLGQQVDDSDSTQQVQSVNFGQLQLGSQNQQVDTDLTQQVEDSNFGKLQIGSQIQQQIDQGQQVQDSHSTQQVENLGSGKLQFGSHGQQQIQLGQQVDDFDLTQQVEGLGSGKLQLGSHGQQQVDNSDLTQQVEGINIGNSHPQTEQVGNSHFTQQTVGTGFGNLELDSQIQQKQDEDNSDLTQQVEGSFTGGIQSGSLQHPQQNGNFERFTSQGQQQSNFGSQQRQSYEFNHLLSNFNRNQKQVALQLENDLSKQLRDAVKSYTISSSGSLNYESTYKNLIRELEKNLTKQLQVVGPASSSTRYTHSFAFTGPEIHLLHKQLKNELKLQLQNEISTATGDRNLNQQQTNQQTSDFGPHHNTGFSGQIEQQSSNSELTQQQQNGFENIEFGGQSQTRGEQSEDLIQQIGYDQQQREFGQGLSHTAAIGGSNSGKLQLGTQQIEQQSSYDQSDLTQQENSPFGNSGLRGQHQIDAQYTNQFQQVEEVNPKLTQSQLQLSGKLQFGNRPIIERPIHSGNFINTEITQQQNLYPHQDFVSQQNNPNYKPNHLPTLNQIIQESKPDGEEARTQYPIEPAYSGNNLNQQKQTEDDQQQKQENIDLSQQSQNSIYQISEQVDLGTEQNRVGQSVSGHGFATNKPLSYAQILSQGGHRQIGSGSETLQVSQQTNSFDQDQDSYDTYLNKQQVQSVHQLKNELSRQLQDVISQNYYTISHSTSDSKEREGFLKALQTNITKQLEEILNGAGFSSHLYYGSDLTQAQKDKLKNDLQASFSRQIEHNLQISYNTQHHHGQQNAHDSGVTYTHGSHWNTHQIGHTNQLHYGQQEVVPDSETASEQHPLEPQQATVVENVEPHGSDYQIGIKLPRKPPITQHDFDPELSRNVQHPQLEATTPSVIQSTGAQEVTDLNAKPQENLPWWKRVGNTIRQGASNLKEKIIG